MDCCKEGCINARFMRGHQRGIMDCDPDEYWCDCGCDYFDGYREYDEEGEELPCEHFRVSRWFEDY